MCQLLYIRLVRSGIITVVLEGTQTLASECNGPYYSRSSITEKRGLLFASQGNNKATPVNKPKQRHVTISDV